MKSFLRFIMFIIIIAVIAYTVIFLMDKNDVYKTIIDDSEGALNSGENDDNPILDFSGDVSGDISGDTELSGDMSGEHSDNGEDEQNSGDTNHSSIGKIEEILNKVNQIDENNNQSIYGTTLDASVLGRDALEMSDFFEDNNFPVTINIKIGKVEIIPASDFMHNQVFYFDENGDLILYESISNTVGGSSKYYFLNGKIIEIDHVYEDDVTVTDEDTSDILTRASIIYERYAIK